MGFRSRYRMAWAEDETKVIIAEKLAAALYSKRARTGRSGGIGRRDSLKNCWGATPVSVRARPSAADQDAELCSGSTGDFGSLSPGSNPGSAAMNSSHGIETQHPR